MIAWYHGFVFKRGQERALVEFDGEDGLDIRVLAPATARTSLLGLLCSAAEDMIGLISSDSNVTQAAVYYPPDGSPPVQVLYKDIALAIGKSKLEVEANGSFV